MYTLQRDPFARGEYARFPRGPGICKWCGQSRKRLYAYVWWDDAKQPPHSDDAFGDFCNFQCFKDYYH